MTYNSKYMKNIMLIAGALIVIGGVAYYFLNQNPSDEYNKTPSTQVEVTATSTTKTEPVVEEVPKNEPTSLIGKSVNDNDIVAYHFGSGDKELLFIGGIHGGYSLNTAQLGFELVDWFKANQNVIPKNVRVTIIPVMNPDGLEKVTGSGDRFEAADVSKVESVKIAGRFNANEVDLNRNFDCEWQPTGTWQNKTVSGGDSAFSEPESKAVRSYVTENKPAAVVTWYSAAGGVYASNCKNGTLPETLALTNLFAKAAGYPAHEEFDYYEITGDMVNWLAGQKIPAISVLLTDRVQTEFNKNRAGVEAVLNYYAE